MFVAWIMPILVSLLVGVVAGVSLYVFRQIAWKSATSEWERTQRFDTKDTSGKPKAPSIASAVLVALLVGALVLGIWSGFSSFTTIDSGYVGVVTRFGEVTGKILLPGLNWKSPHVEQVIEIATRNRTYQTATDAQGTGDYNDYPTDSNTSDGQRITKATWQVTFAVQKECAPYIVTEFGELNAFVRTVAIPKFRAISRDMMKGFEAEQLQQQISLDDLRATTLLRLQKELAEFCLTVTTYDIRDIDFAPEYIATIEAQQIAEERIQTAAFEADAVAEAVRGQITQAEGDAKVRIIDAQAKADSLVISADAQADAIKLVGSQLERYTNYIQLQFVENLGDNVSWGILPDGVLPLLQMDNISK